MIIGIAAAIYSSFFLALSQVAIKKSFKELEPSVAFFFDAMLGLLIWVPLAFFFGIHFGQLPEAFLYAIVSGVLAEALVFYALSKGQLSITAILIGSYPIYTIIFSYFINHERLTSTELVFLSITIIGTLLSYLPSKLSFEELKKSGALFLPLLAAVAIGFSDTLTKGVIDHTSLFTFLFALAIVQVPIALIYLRIEKQKAATLIKHIAKKGGEYKLPFFGSLFNIIGTGLLFLGFSNTLASIASPISATSGAIIVLFSIIFLDEKISIKNLIGLVLIFIGVLGISRAIG